MSKFKLHEKVYVSVDGYLIEATITDVIPSLNKTEYEVSYVSLKQTQWVSVRASEEELIKFNPTTTNSLDNLCECGATKLKHPGHSTWCFLSDYLSID